MQQEDLIKRLRIIAIVATTVFVVLVVTLLIQFGFIASYHKKINQMEADNAALHDQIESIKQRIDYSNGESKIDNPQTNN